MDPRLCLIDTCAEEEGYWQGPIPGAQLCDLFGISLSNTDSIRSPATVITPTSIPLRQRFSEFKLRNGQHFVTKLYRIYGDFVDKLLVE
jgi:hypothetical protein